MFLLLLLHMSCRRVLWFIFVLCCESDGPSIGHNDVCYVATIWGAQYDDDAGHRNCRARGKYVKGEILKQNENIQVNQRNAMCGLCRCCCCYCSTDRVSALKTRLGTVTRWQACSEKTEFCDKAATAWRITTTTCTESAIHLKSRGLERRPCCYYCGGRAKIKDRRKAHQFLVFSTEECNWLYSRLPGGCFISFAMFSVPWHWLRAACLVITAREPGLHRIFISVPLIPIRGRCGGGGES